MNLNSVFFSILSIIWVESKENVRLNANNQIRRFTSLRVVDLYLLLDKNYHYYINIVISDMYSLCMHGNEKMSQCMRFPTMWYVRPAKPQISLRIRAV